MSLVNSLGQAQRERALQEQQEAEYAARRELVDNRSLAEKVYDSLASMLASKPTTSIQQKQITPTVNKEFMGGNSNVYNTLRDWASKQPKPEPKRAAEMYGKEYLGNPEDSLGKRETPVYDKGFAEAFGMRR